MTHHPPSRLGLPRRRRPGRRPVAVALVLGLLLGTVTVAAARPGARTGAAAAETPPLAASGTDPDSAIASVAILVPDERLDARIAALELRGSAWAAAVDRLDDALFAVADNQRALAAARSRLADLGAEVDRLAVAIAAGEAEQRRVDDDLETVEAVLEARALSRFVHVGADSLATLVDPETATAASRAARLSRHVDDIQFSTRDDLRTERARLIDVVRELTARNREASAELVSTASVVAEREAAVPGLAAEVDAATDAVRWARWTAAVPGLDLPVVALDAYLDSEGLLAQTWPSCGLRWWMVAGVARIESWHGSFGGRSLRADGRVDRPIIGIPLDGGPGVRAMPDSDGGRLDGDTVWDRAVGPLQFIPTTWAVRGRDGDGDGSADPQNIYDAAYSAGRYLCSIGGDLTSRAALRRAYFGYNTSTEYVDAVIAHADAYAAFALPGGAAVVSTVENAG